MSDEMALVVIENDKLVLSEWASETIADFERQIKALKAKEDALKTAILEAMEEQNILKFDTPAITINYVAPSDRETFDSKAFKSDHADLYDEYVKMSPVKASIRIKVK